MKREGRIHGWVETFRLRNDEPGRDWQRAAIAFRKPTNYTKPRGCVPQGGQCRAHPGHKAYNKGKGKSKRKLDAGTNIKSVKQYLYYEALGGGNLKEEMCRVEDDLFDEAGWRERLFWKEVSSPSLEYLSGHWCWNDAYGGYEYVTLEGFGEGRGWLLRGWTAFAWCDETVGSVSDEEEEDADSVSSWDLIETEVSMELDEGTWELLLHNK
ncbi:hypothetical protein HK104_001136 [Borealophlyctis nickersoniae]|nr:hypothetical protein HK104_001136 [Borealophlyctis nickersoniae]